MSRLRHKIARIGILAILGVGLAANGSAQAWGPLKDGKCKVDGMRQISAELFNIPEGADWHDVCGKTPRVVMGAHESVPHCHHKKLLGIINIGIEGQWLVPDSTCLSIPPAPPDRGSTGSLASAEPLEGFADIHVHQMADQAFGGSIVWGGAFGDPAVALEPIPPQYKRGHDTTEEAVHGPLIKALANTFLGDLFGHGEDGSPTFSSWPNHNRWTHQQVYQDWLFRAYQGGLRLMVMLAENSEDMFGRGENHVPIIGRRKFQRVKAPGRSGNDMEALEWQVRAAYQMQYAIDQQYGGPGKGWYRIVRDPDEASQIISEGKLAVILGAEIQHLFNCDVDRPVCTRETITDGLDRLEGMGVNYVFLIHHKLNQFGGPATFQLLNSGPTETCVDLRYECSSVGLTDLGQILLKELAARGMLIDTEHMSRKAFGDAMSIVESLKYPVLAGHVVPLDLQSKPSQQTERARTSAELTRVFDVGGMVAPILGTSAHEYSSTTTGSVLVPIRCDASGSGGPDQWANAYLLTRELAKAAGPNDPHAIPLGSDWNGFAGWPGPRHEANDPCRPRHVPSGAPMEIEHPVVYPIELPKELIPAAIGGTFYLDKFQWPKGVRDWDYNLVGAAHVGMLPDFIENLRRLGLTLQDLEPLYRSARGVVDLWKTARHVGTSDGLHNLRWIPQSPFDVISFNRSYYWDESRNVEARTGYSLCRTRTDHRLGFVRNDTCQVVEEANSSVNESAQPTVISGYDAGRCLTVEEASFGDGAKVVQETCNPATSQLWRVHSMPSGDFEIVNINSGKCLTVAGSSFSKRARAVQQSCAGTANQTFKLPRVGNTFHMIPTNSSSCLEVAKQSRSDGAAIQEADCTSASNQLWTMDSLRALDFERLYQADKGRLRWQDTETSDYSRAVTVDDSRAICRSRDSQQWVGVVTDKTCVGKTYDGSSITTAEFERLFQAR